MIYNYILLFFIYSVIGWTMEVVVSLVCRHKFINRGFLIGPLCPIYGVGGLFITLFLDKYKNDLLVFFVMTMILCTFIEYITSYIMEKMFKARWWDYSDKKFNINGRVCLETMIPFGIIGVLITRLGNPLFMGLIVSIPYHIRMALAIALIIVFIFDLIVSTKVIITFKNIKFNKKDSTEEISKKVRRILSEENPFVKRLVDAFPNNSILKKTKQRIEKTTRDLKKKQKEVTSLRKKLAKKQKKLKKMKNKK